jgi:hypothetical protein
MFADLDADNSGELDHKELRVGLAEYFQLNYTNTQVRRRVVRRRAVRRCTLSLSDALLSHTPLTHSSLTLLSHTLSTTPTRSSTKYSVCLIQTRAAASTARNSSI